jgi:hypothetical protein
MPFQFAGPILGYWNDAGSWQARGFVGVEGPRGTRIIVVSGGPTLLPDSRRDCDPTGGELGS